MLVLRFYCGGTYGQTLSLAELSSEGLLFFYKEVQINGAFQLDQLQRKTVV